MWDLEFLSKPRPLAGAIIYRYRSGLLRTEMMARVQDVSSQIGALCASYHCDELRAQWFQDEPLWPSLKVCDLPEPRTAMHQFRRLKPLLSVAPAQPTVIMMRASNYNKGRFPAATVIDEPVVTSSNILEIIGYWAKYSDLPGAVAISNDKSFLQYFRQWIAAEEEASLLEFRIEFERSILAYTEPGSTTFAPPAVIESDPAQKAFVVRCLSKYLRDQSPDGRAEFLQALDVKLQRGWSDSAIWVDLAVASQKALAKITKTGSGVGQPRQSVTASVTTALLWTALLLAAKGRVDQAGRMAPHAQAAPGLLAVEHLCHDFERRIDDLLEDPLQGRWRDLLEIELKASTNTDDSSSVDPFTYLYQTVAIEAGKDRPTNWLLKLKRLLSTSKPAPNAPRLLGTRHRQDLWSFDNLVGQGHVVAEIRKRFEKDDHRRPLVLSGPPGSGKQTIATLYARALVCEQRSGSAIDPCGRCLACQGFSRAGTFDYAEFDLSNPNVVDQSFEKLQEFRRHNPSGRRAVIFRDSDHKDGVLDFFLKTMEDKKTISTYIVLARDERNVRAATVSRGSRFRLQKITDHDAIGLIARWLPPCLDLDDVARLVALFGDRRPGLMWHLSQLLLKYNAVALDSAKDLFELNWGDLVVEYFQALLAGKELEAEKRLRLISDDPLEALRRVQEFIAHAQLGTTSAELWLLFDGQSTDHVRRAVSEMARKLGDEPGRLWERLAKNWLNDTVFDVDSLVEAGRASDLILGGFR